MSLSDWESNDWLKAHETGPEEIHRFLDIADRDLQDCRA
jgi:hypothetical protein